ncbi:WD repeat-containing protein 76-like [Diadema antillarum]|uniref:WD repeat-containing protein 76-like n=2 Tax=Diadema antillarum TaxID=105358 RepID=UPI003A8AF504
MLGINSFYKVSDIEMVPPTNSRSKRLLNPAPEEASPPKRRRGVKKEQGASKVDVKPLPTVNARRSTRISKQVTTLRAEKENSKKIVKKEEVEEEEKKEEEVHPKIEEEEDADTSGLSEYERRRLANISKNAEFFASLDIFQAKENLTALSPAAQKQQKLPTRGLKTKRAPEILPRRAPSLRLQNKSPEGSQLPEKFKEPPLYSLYLPQPSQHERKPSGPIKMEATNVKKEDRNDEGVDFVKGLARLAKGSKAALKVDGDDLERFAKRLQKMTMKETYLAKVVPERIFSVAVHPTCEKTIVCAGDKWGKIGVWDVNSTQGQDGVFLFEPHARPVNTLRFDPNNANKLYSVSYDGTVRCGDLEKMVFEEVYATEDEDTWTSYFDFLSSDARSLLVTQNEGTGHVAVIDPRSRGTKAESVYMVHPRNAKTVSVHPTMPSYFVTASTDATAALWDIRNLKEKGLNKPVATMPHSKSVSSAFFSPITGSKILTTSFDDKISIFETESAKEGKLTGAKRVLWQSHNNHTGRWLSPFKAMWHPRREDMYVVGSMCQPRRIEVFTTKGKLLHNFSHEFLASVCSLNAFHPTRDMIVGGNSSGKLHVLM